MAKIKQYGITEVEKLNGAIKVQIQFDNNLWWEGFLLKRDGAPNKATLKTLVTCGFKGNDITQLIKGSGSGVLNEDKDFELQTEIEHFADKEIEKVKWVNDPDAPKSNRFAESVDRKKLGGASLSRMLSELSSENNDIKNHAPIFDTDEEIPF